MLSYHGFKTRATRLIDSRRLLCIPIYQEAHTIPHHRQPLSLTPRLKLLSVISLSQSSRQKHFEPLKQRCVGFFTQLSKRSQHSSHHVQEPKFIDSDSDDETPVEKRRKVAAGDGKKPPITKEDPVFDAVYKSAASELKRRICFVNAFPTSAESDHLPREVYNHGVRSVKESGLYSHDDLRQLTKAFDGQWFSCVRPLGS